MKALNVIRYLFTLILLCTLYTPELEGLEHQRAQKSLAGTELLELLLNAFPDYSCHAQMEFVNRKKFLKIIHSTENFNQSMSTKIEDVPLLRVFANEGRNFYIEMQNFTEIHVYAESIKEPYHLNILSRF